MRRYEVCKVGDIVRSIDPNAFVIVGDAGEISGEGFREHAPSDLTLADLLRRARKKQA